MKHLHFVYVTMNRCGHLYTNIPYSRHCLHSIQDCCHSDCGWTCGCAGKNCEIPWEHMPHLSASAVVIHYEEALSVCTFTLPLQLRSHSHISGSAYFSSVIGALSTASTAIFNV